MKFRNYCVIVLGDITGVKDVVVKISETSARCIEHPGVFIATFSTNLEAIELKEVFNSPKRTYFVFEVGVDNTSYQIGREDIQEQLFGHIETNDGLLEFMTNNLLGELSNKTTLSGSPVDENQILFDVDKLTKVEVKNEIDNLLDKGLDKLNDNEKTMLDLLTKRL